MKCPHRVFDGPSAAGALYEMLVQLHEPTLMPRIIAGSMFANTQRTQIVGSSNPEQSAFIFLDGKQSVGKCHEIENLGDLGLRIVAGQGNSLVTGNVGSYT